MDDGQIFITWSCLFHLQPYTPSGQTPFMTPYTSQTPRYGQTTPSMSGPFLMPGAPMNGGGGGGATASGSYHGGGRSANVGYHQSPQQQQQQQVFSSRHHHGGSPYVPSPQSRYGGTSSGGSGVGGGGGHDSNDWARANDAWARGSKSGVTTGYGEGSHTPRGG